MTRPTADSAAPRLSTPQAGRSLGHGSSSRASCKLVVHDHQVAPTIRADLKHAAPHQRTFAGRSLPLIDPSRSCGQSAPAF